MVSNLRLLTRGSWSESQRFAEILRKETVGGVLLLVAASVALLWANSPWSHAYRAVSEFAIGPESLPSGTHPDDDNIQLPPAD